MDKTIQQRLLEFLTASFDTDGMLRFLVASAVELKTSEHPTTLLKVRVAVTFQEGDSVIPYFDGTEMYVEIGPSTIQFTREYEWADGPPIMAGSPNELALPWVSELAPPFLISPEALKAANHATINTREMNSVEDPDEFL
ncbi:hypothetical protein [Paenibacillus validus]|uniref:hypothetical protein n=1 Tax=Paenibacillus validus TaxID=44253 RepID=UPI003D27FFBB